MFYSFLLYIIHMSNYLFVFIHCFRYIGVSRCYRQRLGGGDGGNLAAAVAIVTLTSTKAQFRSFFSSSNNNNSFFVGSTIIVVFKLNVKRRSGTTLFRNPPVSQR